jgi:hypothetical protein
LSLLTPMCLSLLVMSVKQIGISNLFLFVSNSFIL